MKIIAVAYQATAALRSVMLREARANFQAEIMAAESAFQRVLSVTSEQDALNEANRVHYEAVQAANAALDAAEKSILLAERQANEKIEKSFQDEINASTNDVS